MLDIKYLRQNIDFVSGKMRERGQEMNLERFITLDAGRREIIREVEGLRGERNAVSKQIGEKKKNREDATDIIARMGLVSARIKELDEALKKTDEDLDAILMTIPNLPHASVVCGRGPEDNPVVRVWGRSRNSPSRRGRTGRSARACTSSISRAGRRSPGRVSPSTGD